MQLNDFYKSMNDMRVKAEGGETKWAPIQDDACIYSYIGLLATRKFISNLLTDERYIGNILYSLESNMMVFFKSSREVIDVTAEGLNNIDIIEKLIKESSWVNRLKYFLHMDVHLNPYKHGITLRTIFNFIGYSKNANRK